MWHIPVKLLRAIIYAAQQNDAELLEEYLEQAVRTTNGFNDILNKK